MKQKATELNESGLTPIQEQAAILLASGENVTSVAEACMVNRTTIYQWQQKLTFRCFFNQQHKEAKETLTNSLFGLYGEALQTLRECLLHGNENVRLKAALAIIERVNVLPIGEVDARKVLKEQCTSIESPYDFLDLNPTESFDKRKYLSLLKENGLVEE